MVLKRQHPLLQLIDLQRQLTVSNRRRNKLICLSTGSGRSVTRLSRRTRLQFRQLLINHELFGIQPSQW